MEVEEHMHLLEAVENLFYVILCSDIPVDATFIYKLTRHTNIIFCLENNYFVFAVKICGILI